MNSKLVLLFVVITVAYSSADEKFAPKVAVAYSSANENVAPKVDVAYNSIDEKVAPKVAPKIARDCIQIGNYDGRDFREHLCPLYWYVAGLQFVGHQNQESAYVITCCQNV